MSENSQLMLDNFKRKDESGELSIAIIGLGYVGVPLAEAYVRAKTRVIGFDINQTRVEELNSGRSGMRHITDERMSKMVESGLFHATTDASAISEADAVLICVPTPLDKYHHPDLSYIVKTCEMLTEQLRDGQLIVLESTTYPGTTSDVMKPILEKSGKLAGKHFGLAYSPEREDPGNIDFETNTIPKLVGADTEVERAMAKIIYDKIVETVIVPNTKTAEAAKLTENIFRWVNIAMVNELKLIFEKMDIDVWEVIEAAKTKPFGYMPFYPGPGVGGHCIRVDPYYLTWKAREHGVSTRFIELAGEINIAMPAHIVTRLMEELNIRYEKALASSKILLCGLAYKRDIDDLRESPSLELFDILESRGAKVDYFDPYIPTVPFNHEFPQFEGRKSIEWKDSILQSYDAVVIATDHTNVDYLKLVENVPLTVDSRNVTKNLPKNLQTKISKA